MNFYTIVGLLSVAIVANKFIKALGKKIPILELILLISGFQWIVGPFIEYTYPSFHFKYYMYVNESVYMSYVAPAYLVFVGMVFQGIRGSKNQYIDPNKLIHFKQYGLSIFLIGIAFDLVAGLFQGSLYFIAYLLSNFKFIGAIILFFSKDSKLKKLFYITLIYLLFQSIQTANFHDLFLWTIFFYMFWAMRYKPSYKQVFFTLIIGFFLISTLQTIKSSFRQKVWNENANNRLELFAGLFVDALFLNGTDSDKLDSSQNNVRLNQGWIISAIMNEIPNNQSYYNGSTVIEAIVSSILPRFLNPNKKEAGGRENFFKFTGLDLSDRTSMGISLVGEGYGNFGVFGGILFIGIWGWVLSKYWVFLIRLTKRNILLLAFLPLIFLQVVKAETELVVVLNHLVKASVLVFLFFWFAKRFIRWRLVYA